MAARGVAPRDKREKGRLPAYVADRTAHWALSADERTVRNRLRHLTTSTPRFENDAEALRDFEEAGRNRALLATARTRGIAQARVVADAASFKAMHDAIAQNTVRLNSKKIRENVARYMPAAEERKTALKNVLAGRHIALEEAFGGRHGALQARKYLYVNSTGDVVKGRVVNESETGMTISDRGLQALVDGPIRSNVEYSLAARAADSLAKRRSAAERSDDWTDPDEGLRVYGEIGEKAQHSAKFSKRGSGVVQVGSKGYFAAYKRALNAMHKGNALMTKSDARKTIAVLLAAAYLATGSNEFRVSLESADLPVFIDSSEKAPLVDFHKADGRVAKAKKAGKYTAAAALGVRGVSGAAAALRGEKQKLQGAYKGFGKYLHPGLDADGEVLGEGVHGDIFCGSQLAETTLLNDYGQFPQGEQRGTVDYTVDRRTGRQSAGLKAATRCVSGHLSGFGGSRYIGPAVGAAAVQLYTRGADKYGVPIARRAR